MLCMLRKKKISTLMFREKANLYFSFSGPERILENSAVTNKWNLLFLPQM